MYPSQIPSMVALILKKVKKILNGNVEQINIPMRKIANRIAMNPPIFHQFFNSSINKDRIKPAGKPIAV